MQQMKAHRLLPEEVFESLAASPTGLSEGEVADRLQKYGPNLVQEVRRTSWVFRFFAQLTHFLAILLWLAAALSFVSEFFNPGEGMLYLGMAIVAVIFLNAAFTFIQEYRAERALEELKKLLPDDVRVMRAGEPRRISSRDVVPGDLLLLQEGDKVPADARLVDAEGMQVNLAALTGESEPRARITGPFAGNYLESPNLVFAGTMVVSGSGRGVVLATGMATEFGKLAHLTGGVEAEAGPLQKDILRLTRILGIIAVILGVVFFATGFLLERGFWSNLLFAIGIIVANVPEGLLPTVTLSLAMGSLRMARKKALIKDLNSVETLGSVTVICSDKTGTLTQNRMEVEAIWTPEATPGGGGDQTWLLTIAYLCNNIEVVKGVYHGDPTEVALFKKARESLGEVRSERLAQIAFSSERERMSTVHRLDRGIFLFTKGARETVLPACSRILAGGEEASLREDRREALKQTCNDLEDQGCRVLAFAFKQLESPEAAKLQGEGADREAAEEDLTFAGFIGLMDPPRPEAREALEKCRRAGVRVIMITGDAARTARSIARKIGLINDDSVILEGPEVEAMSDRELREKIRDSRIIFARMTPRRKLKVVSLLKEMGERVAVTGDGVNDAPALRKADIGIAMGKIGTDVAREAANMVLLDDNFATIVNAIEEGRAVYLNIRKFISYILASNIPEIVPYIAYVLLGIPLPLTILQILAVDLGTDMLPGLALGMENPDPEVMREPPRPAGERLLNWKILVRSYLFLGPIEAAAGLCGYFYVLNSGGWEWGQMLAASSPLYLQATTACWGAIVITQIGNIFACRSFRTSVFSLGLFSNPMVLWGIVSEIIIAAFFIYHPWGNWVLGTAPLSGYLWLMLAPFGILLLSLEEGRKFLVRGVFSRPT